MNEKDNWDLVIKPKSGLFDLKLAAVWRYRDLFRMFIKRDFISFYKQTILGPLWFLIQPVFTMLVYIVVFTYIAKIPTGKTPPALFYLSGIIAWTYFLDCFLKTSNVFKDNQAIFGKVYFPRLIMPLSIVVSNLIRFAVQFGLFLALYFYYYSTGFELTITRYVLIFPLLVVLMAFQGLGLGMIISSLTIKYRDLAYLVTFGSQLLMYATPVVYPLSFVPAKYQAIISLNPMAPIIEGIRLGFLGEGQFGIQSLAYVSGVSVIILIVGTIVFNKVEKNFVDTV